MSTRYEIVVEGSVGPILSAMFEGFEQHQDPLGRVRLVGEVADQSELHGMLHRLHDLRAVIVDVHRVDVP